MRPVVLGGAKVPVIDIVHSWSMRRLEPNAAVGKSWCRGVASTYLPSPCTSQPNCHDSAFQQLLRSARPPRHGVAPEWLLASRAVVLSWLTPCSRRDPVSAVTSLLARSAEFAFYHCLLAVVDRVCYLPRGTMLPEAARLYRENIALKAQLDALERHIRVAGPKTTKRPLSVRAAQVFAYLLTRGDEPFQRYFLSAPITTIKRWATKFRRVCERPVPSGGRPELASEVVDLIVTLKMENRSWGQRRIREELRRMGIRVSEPTIKKVLLEHGFSPNPGRKLDFSRFRSAAKDAVWALDFFLVKTAANTWMQVLLILDIHTRERIDFRVHDGWDVESRWTARVFNEALVRTGRRPVKVIHDHGTHFMGQFERQLRVLGIERDRTVPGLPSLEIRSTKRLWLVQDRRPRAVMRQPEFLHSG
jgi:hypothetical protein